MNVDPIRLGRALALNVEHLEGSTYVVSGGAEPHIVEGAHCDCADAVYGRTLACKHVLAVHLARRLSPLVLVALRELVHPEEDSSSVATDRSSGT